MPAADTSRKASVASIVSGLPIDQPLSSSESADRFTGSDDFISPMDEILALTQNIYEKRLKLSVKDIQFIDNKIHEMKSRIINSLLTNDRNINTLNTAPPQPVPANIFSHTSEWPALPKKKSKSTLVVKPESDKYFRGSDVLALERKVSDLISEENIDATIFSSASTMNGDIVIKFDEKDDVKKIAQKVETNLGYQTQSRTLSFPKITISHIPKYIPIEKEDIKKLIVKSNKWLENLINEGETFDVIFSYDVRDWRSVVCKVSPKIRSHTFSNNKTLRIANRSCPVKDRFHVKQCGKCLGFGHKTQACLKSQFSCAHCNEDHHKKDCPHKDDDDKLTCSNCKKSNDYSEAEDVKSLKHSAYSHSCPFYVKQLKRQIDQTHWGEGPVPPMPCYT